MLILTFLDSREPFDTRLQRPYGPVIESNVQPHPQPPEVSVSTKCLYLLALSL